MFDLDCDICDRPFIGAVATSKYCSDKCKSVAVKKQQRSKHFRAKARKETDPQKKEEYLWLGNNPGKAVCQECSMAFNQKAKLDKYCSDDCRKTGRLKIDSKSRKKIAIKKHDEDFFLDQTIKKLQLEFKQILSKKEEKKLKKLKEKEKSVWYLTRGDIYKDMSTGCCSMSCNY